MPLKPSLCTLIIEHEQSSARQVWVKSAPLLSASSCHTIMCTATQYRVTHCWISYFGPSLGPTHSPIRACPHMMSTRLHGHQLVENHADIMEAFFFFPLQHVRNSPAVPEIEAFSLIYHQSVRPSAERGLLFRPGNEMRREQKRKEIIMCGCRGILTCII